MADYDEQDASTRSLMFVSEMAKTLEISTEEIRRDLGTKLLSRSTAITTEFENHVVDQIKEQIIRVKSLNKEIYLDQRLSDNEKTNLMRLFTPPYKLKFSSNASDIGAHLYYRSLNEIATFRCYDLLTGMDNKLPVNRDVLVKEVGASVSKIVKYGRKHVHACTPNLTMDDTMRLANTSRTLQCIINDVNQPKNKRELAKLMSNNPKHRCYNRSEHCKITSKFLVFAHSSYDCDLTSIADMMDSAEAVRAMGFMHYSPTILSNIVEGSDNGLNWKLECCTFSAPIRKYGKFIGSTIGHCKMAKSAGTSIIKRDSSYNKKQFVIKFWFDDDYQNAYVHRLDTYLGLIRKSICVSRMGTVYMIQRRENLGGLLFYEIVRPEHPIPRTHISRMIPFADPDNIIVHYYQLQNDPEKYNYHELIPDRLVVPKKFFEKLYYYLFCLADGKFTTQNAIIVASTMASRTVINGSYVSQPYNMSIDLIDKVAHAAYFIVYCRRYDLMLTLKKLKQFEDIRRNPTIYNRLCIMMRHVKNFVFGTSFEELKSEETFEGIIENGTAELLNKVATTHSVNILKWIAKLFRINRRYKVDFFPITRVVSIEEDIDTVTNIEVSLPKVAPESELDDIDCMIRERLHISHVSKETCTISDTECKSQLYSLANDYTNQCLLKCFCNGYNITVAELRSILLHSKYYERLFMTTKLAFRESIMGDISDINLFELISCEFGVNICVHTENKEILYDVKSNRVMHFQVADNHCTELRERMPFEPFEFFPTNERIQYPDMKNLEEAYKVDSAKKLKMHSVVVDTIYPYVCRAALKLQEIDTNYGIITTGKICEISAAPGSWVQYCHLNHPCTDIYYTHYSDGLDFIYDHEDITNLCDDTDGDITKTSFFEVFTKQMELIGRMNVVLSDAIILKDGEDVVDVEKFSNYQEMFFVNVKEWLNDNGNVVFKSFANIPISDNVENVLKHFDFVHFVKPNFSAPLSTEYYIVAKGLNLEKLPEDVSYHSIPSLVATKVINKATLLLKNKFPPQKKYVIPIIPVKASNKNEVIEYEPVVEDDEEPSRQETVIVETDDFEQRLVKILNKLEFFDAPKSEFLIHQDDASLPPGTFDAIINFYDTALISDDPSCIVYDVPHIAVDFSTIGFRDMLTKLFTISNKILTFRLKIMFNVTAVREQKIVESILTHIKEKFSSHEVHVRANYTNCNVDVTKFERSILEYITYTREVKNVNVSTYRYIYNGIATNDYILSHTLKSNISVNTQNMSVLFGNEYRYKHPKIQDDYTHAYCGVSDAFIPFADLLPNRWYIVGDYCYRMFDDILVDRVRNIDIDKLKDVQFVLIQGVAGHGKTQEIVSKHKPSLINLKGDLLVTPTSSGKTVLLERTCKIHKLNLNALNKSCYRTVTSFLMHTNEPADFTKVFFDEAIMVHVALVLATAYYSGCKYLYMYGDTAQIPAHSHLGGFEFEYHAPQKLFDAQAIRNKSYRIPPDVAACLNSTYKECHKHFGNSDVGIITTSVNLRSLKVVKIHDISEMRNYYSENVKYLTFTHTTANDLQKLDSKFGATTIAAFQGSENPEIAIVRTSISEADQIYNNENLCVTALTRHTKSLTYYTTCHKGDFLMKAIDYANSLTDQAIKKFSTSLSVGSILGKDYVIGYDEPTVTRFFKSRQKFTHSFTFVDHRNVDTEKAFALSISSINNDVFVDKSIFKKFNMSDLLKWIRKLSPHVKQIFVRVHNESFQNDPKIIELVEEYKCKNVIPTQVTQNLVATLEPMFTPHIEISNYIYIKPTVELVQVFMSHLFPNSVYVPNQLDAYFVHTNDIDYTLKDVSLSPLYDRYEPSIYDTLRPVLSTPAPAKRDVTFREILLGIMKRNLNPPELVENACPKDVACHLLQNFSKMLVKDYSKIIVEMDPIIPTTQSIVSWLEKQDRSVLKNIIHDIPICLARLSDCALSLKRNPKVRISPTAIDIYDSVQTITCHPKFVNAYFCSVVEAAQDRLMKLMLPWFKIYTKRTIGDFSKDCYLALNTYGKLYLFSGDDSLLVNGNHFKEMDMSKFDKSQLIFALEFLTDLFIKLGVPKYTAQLYYEMMYFRICRDPHNKVTVALTPQMESGSAATYFGNTCFCAAVVMSCLDLESFGYTPRFEKFSLMFNLEVKEFKYANPYFCSKFVVIDDNKFKFLPDPVKILIKLGRTDLKNFKHLKEFHISLKDLVSQYDCFMDISVVSAAIRERYEFPYDCTTLIQNLISLINDDSLFCSLFYTLPGDHLDHRAISFSED
ncbi:hypothetical protein 1 [Agua Salud negevirus]|nr:hypothetical protein 1 [Agua Salud negevirus]